MKRSAMTRPRRGIGGAATLLGLFGLMLPETVYGAGLNHTHWVKAMAGSLPMYAALAVGIGVAVLSVIAFLQMTRGKNAPAVADGQETGSADFSPYAVPSARPSAGPAAEAEEEMDDGEPEARMPDYTIPLPGIPKAFSRPDAFWQGKPRIYGLGGRFAGETFRVTDKALFIGRDPSVCHIVFPADAGEISRRHCSIRYDSASGTFYLEDHGSSNGTFLPGGEKLVPGKSYPLKAGDRFALSGDSHWFEIRH